MTSAVAEYFTQREALERFAQDPPSARSTRRTLALRARQKREAAEAVFAVSFAESLLLMRDALLLFERAINETGPAADFHARCLSLGIDDEATGRLERTLAGLASHKFPDLEPVVSEADVEFFGELSSAAAVMNRALSPRILEKRDFLSRRLKRRIVAAAVGIAAVLSLYLALRPAPCRASASLADEFRGDMAIDGDATTEWLLPDRKDGWLDVRVSPARNIRLVRLTNGHNRTFNDRAVRGYRIEAYAGKRLLNTVDGEFPALLPSPVPVEVPLVAKGVDRVRLVVTSWFGSGAALAELKIE